MSENLASKIAAQIADDEAVFIRHPDGATLSYQEARIYHWHQAADKLIGGDKIPEELRVQQVIGDDWIYPNDPRLALI